MKLSPVVQRYFDVWIELDTWDSNHSLDQERFYRFVKSVKRYAKNKPTPTEIKDLIVERWKGRKVKRHLIASAQKYANKYETILRYEQSKGFPNWLIERTSLVKCYIELSSYQNAKSEQIDRIMTRLWGKDWKSEVDSWIISLSVPLDN